MTKEEIIQKGKFYLNKHNQNYSEFRIKLYLKIFDQEQDILFANLPSVKSEPKITVVTSIVNELLNYDLDNKIWLKEKVWNHFELCVDNTSYGMVPDQGFKSESEANRAYFQVTNQEEAYSKIELTEVWSDMDFTEFRSFNLSFKCPWEDEHGILIGVKNGQFDSMN